MIRRLRKYGLLWLAGLPALLAAAAFVAALITAPSKASVAKAYELEGAERAKKGELASALVCYKRVVALEPDRPAPRFALAVILDALGKRPEAEALARSIAPDDRGGFAPAHLWLAQRILTDRARLPARAAQAEGHLLRYLQKSPEDRGAMALLGGLYVQTGRFQDARARLEPVAGQESDRLLDLARACQGLGDADAASRHAQAALKAARASAESKPDDRAARLLWANACLFLRDYTGALDVLERGATLTGDPIFRQGMAGVCAVWAAELEKRGVARAAERFTVIERGLKHDPANGALLAQLNNLVTADGTGAEGEKARSAIRAFLTTGKAPALAHFALGNDAWARGKFDEARNHWEQSYRLEPGFGLVANNLAYALTFREPVDVTHALELIDNALRVSPDDPRLRETRGEILVKSGRPREGLADLEAALSRGQNGNALHEALATAYGQLGMTELAAEHKALSTP